MEVGAVKQAYNNELILLKKKLNQAKIQVIHKLTRKAKTLVEKKVPEPLQEKLKRKAESAVKEVLIIKKIKARDLGKFIVTHKGQLQECLNKPQVDLDKACARLLLHKALQDKYKFIKNRFADVPIKDLLMSRQERLKIKKEAREKQKEKRDKKNKAKNQVVNAEGDWDVEDVKNEGKPLVSDNDEKMSDDEQSGSKISNNNESHGDKKEGISDEDDDSDNDDGDGSVASEQHSDLEENEADTKMKSDDSDDGDVESDSSKFIKLSPIKKETKPSIQKAVSKNLDFSHKRKPEKKHKDNKNLTEKILNRKFKKDSDDAPIAKNKIVDPFFITSTGENYLTLAEPRLPDEVKEVHKQGNRKLRRAIMFGYVPKPKPRQDRQDNYRQRQDNHNQDFNRQNGRSYDKFDKQNNKFNIKDDKRSHFKGNFRNETINEEKPEKLHPSWEAKKKQSGILPFLGKKIVFDES